MERVQYVEAAEGLFRAGAIVDELATGIEAGATDPQIFSLVRVCFLVHVRESVVMVFFF